jgi:hypothetical protein
MEKKKELVLAVSKFKPGTDLDRDTGKGRAPRERGSEKEEKMNHIQRHRSQKLVKIWKSITESTSSDGGFFIVWPSF